jgi:hypothetical protein
MPHHKLIRCQGLCLYMYQARFKASLFAFGVRFAN